MLVGQTDWISKREKMSSRSGSKMRGDNFGDVENFAGDLATMMFVFVVLCHRRQRVAFLNACLTQDVQVNGDALDGQTGKIVRQQIKIFAVERNDRDVVSQLAQGIRQVGGRPFHSR